MGLFHKTLRGSTWSNAAPTLVESLSTQGSMEVDETSSTSSSCNTNDCGHDASNAEDLVRKIQHLEQQLRQRDESLSHLRTTMEAQEKSQSERIALLERQVELLVELSSEEGARPAERDKGEDGLSLGSEDGGTDGAQEAHDNEGSEKLESAALLELLARVIAEKDRLAFWNHHLKELVRLRSPASEGSIPVGIVRLDSLMSKEADRNEQHNEGRVDVDDLTSTASEERQENISDQKGDSNRRVESAEIAPRRTEEAVLYKLSCRACPDGCSGVNYVGSSPATLGGLTKVLKGHFAQVWDLAQEDRSSNSSGEASGERRDECNDGEGTNFASSSLARHLAKHCRSFASKHEVRGWCRENIKVKVEKHDASSDDREEKKIVEVPEKQRRASTGDIMKEGGGGLVLCEV